MLSHIGRLHAGRDVPIDVPHVIMRLVFTQVSQLQASTSEQGFVVSLQQAI
jgi:hypothetical protein